MSDKNESTIKNIGDKKEPSQKAIEQFVDLYIEVVKRNEEHKGN
ncbi:MAG TPA: hypothetical protein VNM69_18045 [Bacillus sp. (in: firmicutes)]|nr:hypothetical protein [Bacillus sp. (in: firmicutes)]